MNRTLKYLLLASMLCAAHAASAQTQAESFEGIWQDESDSESYFSLHIEGDEVVLVDLAGLERTGKTLASSYYGRLHLTPSGLTVADVQALSPQPDSQGSAEIGPGPDNTLYIYWCHEPEGNCVVGVRSTLRKIF